MATPSRFGRYEILERLGRGGMGIVYRASDPSLQRDVAIKVLSSDLLIDEDARARFHREGRALAALSHPSIVTILDIGEEDGTPFIVTEFLRGSDLARRMRETPPLSLAEKLHVISSLCEGLAVAHEAGIVHCDVKPANVWLLPNGDVKVLDFGIARGALGIQTHGSGAMGSPYYMAPEQLSGKAVDARADIFALGVVMYELLAGCKPFSGDTPTAVMLQILNAEPPDLATLEPGLPSALVQVVLRALEKNPLQRFQTVRELRIALREIPIEPSDQGANPAVPVATAMYVEPELTVRELTPQRWHRRFVPLAAALVVAAAMGGLFVFRSGSDEIPSISAAGHEPKETAFVAAETEPPDSEPADPITWLQVDSTPSAAVFSLDGEVEEFVTPALIPLPAGKPGPLRFRKQGYRPVERTLSPEEQESGVLHVELEPLRAVPLRAEGSYEFEVRVGDRVASPSASRHELTVQSGTMVTFRSLRHMLDESMRVESSVSTYNAPQLGGVSLRVADSLMRCEARIVSEPVSRRRQVELRLGHPPFDGTLSIVPGRYELEFTCPDTAQPAPRAFTVVANQVETLRILAGSQ